MHPLSVIIKPVISEKASKLRERQGKLTFIVRQDATKADVKRAAKTLWDVDVTQVRTSIRRGKVRRRGAHVSQPRSAKYALIAVKPGQSIPLFEDQ